MRRATTVVGVLAAVLLGPVACTRAASAPATSPPSTSPPSTSAAPTSAVPATPAPVPPGPATSTGSTRGLVVGLGDSVTAGTSCGCRPFIAQYAAALAARDHVATGAVNLGRSGLTIAGLTTQVAATETRRTLGTASVVVVTIGANDLAPLVGRWRDGDCDDECVRDATAGLAGPLDGVLSRVRAQVPGGAHLLVTTYWNVFEDGDVADGDYGPRFAQWSDTVTAQANSAICTAALQVHATCVDLYRSFNGAGGKDPTPLLADDGDHPNAAGHALIARDLLAATPSSS